MTTFLDEISPRTVGEDRIKLSLADPFTPPRAFAPVEVLCDFAACDPEGVALPLELTITPPTRTSFERRYARRSIPPSITFVPKEGGPHLVRIQEVAHNRWLGTLLVDVLGEASAGAVA